MEHSIALITGTTSGLGYAAARMLATEGCGACGVCYGCGEYCGITETDHDTWLCDPPTLFETTVQMTSPIPASCKFRQG